MTYYIINVNRLKEDYVVILEYMTDMSLDMLCIIFIFLSLSAERKSKLERPYPDEVCFLNGITVLELRCH